jgi:hypothetical protein
MALMGLASGDTLHLRTQMIVAGREPDYLGRHHVAQQRQVSQRRRSDHHLTPVTYNLVGSSGCEPPHLRVEGKCQCRIIGLGEI